MMITHVSLQILRKIRVKSKTWNKKLYLRLIMTVMATKDLITARRSNATPSSVMRTSARTLGEINSRDTLRTEGIQWGSKNYPCSISPLSRTSFNDDSAASSSRITDSVSSLREWGLSISLFSRSVFWGCSTKWLKCTPSITNYLWMILASWWKSLCNLQARKDLECIFIISK